MVTAVRFLNGQKPFLLTTAAQNIHVFLRKSPLCRNHFFGWSKTVNSSTAYGTVTLKSPPSRAFSVPDVHPRLRKRPPRCTLDCGFETSESPALRAEVIGQSVGSDASRLSCFLFRPRKSCENRRKRSHTNVSSTLSTRASTPPAQMPHVCFHE